ncbi:MAG: chorismate synthase [Bdellovibrio sp.]|nr:MAG: chorismate synthase [Bdellovibrio sp.]
MSSANQWGHLLRLTSFGESHGPAMGVVIDGCPAGLPFDHALLKRNLQQRRPGRSPVVSARQEMDEPLILSGVYKDMTLGTPIAIIVKNTNARPQDYSQMKERRGHADKVWKQKFFHTDPRGGGRSSGRETVARVLGGSVAEMLVKQLAPQTDVKAFTSQLGPVTLSEAEKKDLCFSQETLLEESFYTGLPVKEKAQRAYELLEKAKKQGDSYGGTITVKILHPPPSLGQPVFHKIKADLAQAMLSIGATHGLTFGDPQAHQLSGTQLHKESPPSVYGGILGGLTTGEPITFHVYFKPTSSILDIATKGRHDPCILPRALAVVRSMTFLVLADHLLWTRLDNLQRPQP